MFDNLSDKHQSTLGELRPVSYKHQKLPTIA
jgi:hypothetical protein